MQFVQNGGWLFRERDRLLSETGGVLTSAIQAESVAIYGSRVVVPGTEGVGLCHGVPAWPFRREHV